MLTPSVSHLFPHWLAPGESQSDELQCRWRKLCLYGGSPVLKSPAILWTWVLKEGPGMEILSHNGKKCFRDISHPLNGKSQWRHLKNVWPETLSLSHSSVRLGMQICVWARLRGWSRGWETEFLTPRSERESSNSLWMHCSAPNLN